MNAYLDSIRARLFSLRDLKYRDFQATLLPTLEKVKIIGVRMPLLRKLAKEYVQQKNISLFLHSLPHPFYDENVLHALILNEAKEYSTALKEIRLFLPYVNNWAVCDTLSLPSYSGHEKEFHSFILSCLSSKKPYTIRFGLDMLMKYYMNDKFHSNDLKLVSSIINDDYYVKMAISWYYATALSYQWENTIPYLKEHRLSPWIESKTIQKALESYRIEESQKTYLKSLRQKRGSKHE